MSKITEAVRLGNAVHFAIEEFLKKNTDQPSFPEGWKDDRFPHECPRCKGPAYVGFTSVECKRQCP